MRVPLRIRTSGRYIFEQEELPGILPISAPMGGLPLMGQWATDRSSLLYIGLAKWGSLGKPFRSPEPQFPHPQIGNNSPCPPSVREVCFFMEVVR